MTIILVRAATLDSRVALWERDPAHPGGEVQVVGDGQAIAVALTPAVAAQLRDGRLVAVAAAARLPAPTAPSRPVSLRLQPGDIPPAVVDAMVTATKRKRGKA
jgi:hypothetical protein